MTRKEAFEVLGLRPGSNKYDIERRYTLLAKQNRGKCDEETIKKLEQITLAYDVLTGRYVPPPPPDPRMEKVVFGKKRREWANIWAYGKVPFFVTLIVLFFVGWLIYTVVTNKPPDFATAVYGDFYQTQGDLGTEPMGLETLIREQNPDFEKPILSCNIIAERPGLDPQMVMASNMKMTLMMTGAEKIDLLVLDKVQYLRLVGEGILLPMDHVYERLMNEVPELFDGYIEPLKTTLDPDVLAEGETPAEHIYGFDLSEKQMLNSLDLAGRTQVLCLCYHSPRRERTEEVLYQLLASYKDWYDPEAPLLIDKASGTGVPAESSKETP